MINRLETHAPEESHHESYLVSVSDLMAGLVLVLMVLLMAFAFQVFRASEFVRDEQKRLTEAKESRDRALKKIASSLYAVQIKVSVDLDRGLVRLPEEMLFESGRAGIRPAGWHAIRLLARELAETLPTCSGLEAVLVEGHTDNTPIYAAIQDGDKVYRDNWDLSYARAKKTEQALLWGSPKLETLTNPHGVPLLGMAAYGETRPAFDNTTPDGRAGNRRIDVRLVLEAPSARK